MGTTAVGMVGQLAMVPRMAGNWVERDSNRDGVAMVPRMAGNWIGGAGQWAAGGFVKRCRGRRARHLRGVSPTEVIGKNIGMPGVWVARAFFSSG